MLQNQGIFPKSYVNFTHPCPTHAKVGLSALQCRSEWAYLLCREVAPDQGCVGVPRRHFNKVSNQETFMDESTQCSAMQKLNQGLIDPIYTNLIIGSDVPKQNCNRPLKERLCVVFNISSFIHTIQIVIQYLESH